MNIILKKSTECIVFELIDSNLFSGINYQNILNLNQFQRLNPYFKLFTSIKKVIKITKKLIENNNINIKDNNSEILLYFVNPIDEEEKIYIPLNRAKEDQKILIKNLYQIVKELKEENNHLKKEINEMKKEDYNFMKKEIEELNKDKTLMKNKIEELEKDKILKDNKISTLIKENILIKQEINDIIKN